MKLGDRVRWRLGSDRSIWRVVEVVEDGVLRGFVRIRRGKDIKFTPPSLVVAAERRGTDR